MKFENVNYRVDEDALSETGTYSILEIIRSRTSIRSFIKKEVDRSILEFILETARWAPSGKNTQPWQVAVVQGETQKKIIAALLASYRQGEKARPDYHYYTEKISPEIKARAFACGLSLYRALGIERNDVISRKKQWELNYQSFYAPVTLFIFIDPSLEKGSWLDLGMFIQTILLSALAFDLGTCAQASLAEYPDIVKNSLGPPFLDKHLVCGISMGYPERQHPVNTYRTEREPLSVFSRFYA